MNTVNDNSGNEKLYGFYRPTLQTTFGEDGNCMSACIATLFNISIDDVPIHYEENWLVDMSVWMSEKFGKYMVCCRFEEIEDATKFLCGSMMITGVDSPHPQVERHSVITRDGEVIFDPMVGETSRPLIKDEDPAFFVIGDVVKSDREKQ